MILPAILFFFIIIIIIFFLGNRLSNFHQISHGAFCRNEIDNLFEWFRAIKKMAVMPMYDKKIFFQKQESFEAESWNIASGTQRLLSLFK